MQGAKTVAAATAAATVTPTVDDPMRRTRNGWRNGERGQALIEMALVLPLIFVFILVRVDFGIALDRREVLQHAVREGARHAAVAADINAIKQRTVDQSQGVLSLADVSVCYLDTNGNGRAGDPGDDVRAGAPHRQAPVGRYAAGELSGERPALLGGGPMRNATGHSGKEVGQALILWVLAATIIFAIGAITVDFGLWLTERRGAQKDADAATMAGAFELLNQDFVNLAHNNFAAVKTGGGDAAYQWADLNGGASQDVHDLLVD